MVAESEVVSGSLDVGLTTAVPAVSAGWDRVPIEKYFDQ